MNNAPTTPERSGPPSAGASPRRAVLYPNCYIWYVFMAAMDIMMTYIILSPAFEGVEVNVLADWILRSGGFYAAIVFKLAIVAMVITICEVVGRRHFGKGRRLAEWSVAITAIPVIASFAQLLVDVCAVTFASITPET